MKKPRTNQADQPDEPVYKQALRAFAMLSQLGISMAACILVGVLLGKGLDSWLGTSPWMLLFCSVVGGAAAIRAIFEFAKG